jgi:hypothetical protein
VVAGGLCPGPCSSDNLIRELRDLVEVLLDVGEGLAAVAVGLFDSSDLRSEVARSRYLDAGDQPSAGLVVEAAFDLEVEVRAAESRPGVDCATTTRWGQSSCSGEARVACSDPT